MKHLNRTRTNVIDLRQIHQGLQDTSLQTWYKLTFAAIVFDWNR